MWWVPAAGFFKDTGQFGDMWGVPAATFGGARGGGRRIDVADGRGRVGRGTDVVEAAFLRAKHQKAVSTPKMAGGEGGDRGRTDVVGVSG
jgi:hypothetical protein